MLASKDTISDWQATTGVRVKHARRMARRLKSASDVSVWRTNHVSGASSATGIVSSNGLERRSNPVCRTRGPNRVRPELPGIKLTTYRTQGSPREHGNLQLSAGTKTSGKPPSPAMSQRRGRVLVVVGARESRVHGEGGQSMRSAALSLG